MLDLLAVWYWHLGRTAAALVTALLALRIGDTEGNWRRELTGAEARVSTAGGTANGTARYGIWRRSTTPGQPDRLCGTRLSYVEAEHEQRSIAAAARSIGRKGCYYVRKQ